ncbi:hypothetical protein K470DRAFT_254454 [Piedraia hortae CBS 480.64]|uniref:Uncharacterized protein n=1 Tax=Piedraia hortae CBS 480.64 TaxID=1314780 RepID=A0A6A7C9Q6_9PEZI|nr:hypothetical protein K470DRAFT_254454 [Piedraia hortae CBS 480.64]
MQIAYHSSLYNPSSRMRPLTTVCDNFTLCLVDSKLKATLRIRPPTLNGQNTATRPRACLKQSALETRDFK